MKSARDELQEAERRKVNALQAGRRDDLIAEGETVPDGEMSDRKALLSALSSAVNAARDSDHEARRKLAARQAETQRRELDDVLASLQPWSGDLSGLTSLRLPDEAALDRWEGRLVELKDHLSGHRRDIARLASECRQGRVEIEGIEQTSGVVDDASAARLRSEREKAWAAHRQAMDDSSADVFEAALREDDIASAARLGHAGEAERIGQLLRALRMNENSA